MKNKPIKIYKNGMGIHEVLEQLQQQVEQKTKPLIVYSSTGSIHPRHFNWDNQSECLPTKKIDLLP